MHGLLIGVGLYQASKPRQKNLSAHDDVDALARYWKEHRGGLYETANFSVLTNEKASPKGVQKALDSLVGKVKPDDLLIFHLGGHGLNLDMMFKEMRDLVAKKEVSTADYNKAARQTVGLGNFVFVCADFDLFDNLQNTVISVNDLYDKLVQLPCHKLIFLDACHAGAVDPDMRSGNDLIRSLTKEGVGPVIFSACRPDQVALEIPGAFFVDDLVGGVFTQGILNTLVKEFDKADSDKNGHLDPHEFSERLKARIPAWIETLKQELATSSDPQERAMAKDLAQNPVVFLPDLERRLAIVERRKAK
jgi:hypothetical protein